MRADVVAAARLLIHTPFGHQGRIPGVALDCAGVVVETALACGAEFEDWTAHRRFPREVDVVREMDERFDRVDSIECLEVGDFLGLVMPRSREMRHLAVYVGSGRMVHVEQDRDVCEEAVPTERVRMVWRMREAG